VGKQAVLEAAGADLQGLAAQPLVAQQLPPAHLDRGRFHRAHVVGPAFPVDQHRVPPGGPVTVGVVRAGGGLQPQLLDPGDVDHQVPRFLAAADHGGGHRLEGTGRQGRRHQNNPDRPE